MKRGETLSLPSEHQNTPSGRKRLILKIVEEMRVIMTIIG